MQVRRLLFIRTDRLGETLLTLPSVASLKTALPQASLTFLASPHLRPLLEHVPILDGVLEYAPDATRGWGRRAARLAVQLRAHGFDVAIVSNPMKELHLAVWLAGIPCRVGYDRKWGCLLTHRVADRRVLGSRHEIEYNFDLIRALGIDADRQQGVGWGSFEPEDGEVLRLLQEQGLGPSEPFIALHPWTSNPLKQWPLSRFQELLRRMTEELALRVVVVGGQEEANRAGMLIPPGVPAINLVGRLTLTQLAALLKRATVLISNDSGPVHLAAALNTRTLVLFGAANDATGPRRWGPWGSRHAVIWRSSMAAIGTEEVFRALHDMMSRG